MDQTLSKCVFWSVCKVRKLALRARKKAEVFDKTILSMGIKIFKALRCPWIILARVTLNKKN